MNIVVHPDAADELNGAVAFYASRANRELAHALIDEFEKVVRLLAANPNLGSQWIVDSYRYTLRRFPFNVVYRFKDEQLVILAWRLHITEDDQRTGKIGHEMAITFYTTVVLLNTRLGTASVHL